MPKLFLLVKNTEALLFTFGGKMIMDLNKTIILIMLITTRKHDLGDDKHSSHKHKNSSHLTICDETLASLALASPIVH